MSIYIIFWDLLIQMSNIPIHALVGGSNYSGSWRVYQSLPDAVRFSKILTDQFKVPKNQITELFSNDYNSSNIVKELVNLGNILKEPGKIGVIYFAGHGTQVRDTNGDEADGKDEALQTNDRRLVTDDQITKCLENAHPTNWVIMIADTCHSPSFDITRLNQHKRWVSIKAAQDYESALQSGDGSCMSVQLFDILKEKRKRTVREMYTELDSRLKASFVGGLQTCKVEVTNENIWNLEFPL